MNEWLELTAWRKHLIRKFRTFLYKTEEWLLLWHLPNTPKIRKYQKPHVVDQRIWINENLRANLYFNKLVVTWKDQFYDQGCLSNPPGWHPDKLSTTLSEVIKEHGIRCSVQIDILINKSAIFSYKSIKRTKTILNSAVISLDQLLLWYTKFNMKTIKWWWTMRIQLNNRDILDKPSSPYFVVFMIELVSITWLSLCLSKFLL